MMGYTLAAMPFFGGLYGFLGTSQQVFVDHYGLSDNAFPVAFAVIAGGIGLTSYANSRLVMRIGQRRLSHGALVAFTLISAVHAAILMAGVDNLYIFLVLLAAAMAFLGLIAANFSALAMEPVGHIAGTASAAYGFMTGVVGALIGSVIGQMYNGTAVPLIAAQAVLAALALVLVFVTERGKLFAVVEDWED
jgi:DHA1 family bicyclomycin/chloramphenicol resistance-like MFS transporter